MATIPTNQDFKSGPLADHGVTVTRTPVTKTIDNLTGDRQFSDGSTNNISIVFENPNIVFEIMNQGEQESAEAGDQTVKAFVAGDVTINTDDKITWNSIVFRIESISPRYFGANLVFKKLEMILIT